MIGLEGGGQDRLAPHAPGQRGEGIGHRLPHVPVRPHRDRPVVDTLREPFDTDGRDRGEGGDGPGLQPEEPPAPVYGPLQVQGLAPALGEGPRPFGQRQDLVLVEARGGSRALSLQRAEAGAVDPPPLGLGASRHEGFPRARHRFHQQAPVAPGRVDGEAHAGDAGRDLLLHDEAHGTRSPRVRANALPRSRGHAAGGGLKSLGEGPHVEHGLVEPRERALARVLARRRGADRNRAPLEEKGGARAELPKHLFRPLRRREARGLHRESGRDEGARGEEAGEADRFPSHRGLQRRLDLREVEESHGRGNGDEPSPSRGRRRSRAGSSGGLKRYPWNAAQPRDSRKARWPSVSTPSATTSRPRLPARARIAWTIDTLSGSAGSPLHERAVDLHAVEAEAGEVAERRVAGAEVVEDETHPQAAQPAQPVLHVGHVAHHHRLRHLELEAGGAEPAVHERPVHVVHHVRLQELLGGEVHGHPRVGIGQRPGEAAGRAQHPGADGAG